MKKSEIIRKYREWRKANGNRKPNRVYVKMRWDDEEERVLRDRIAIIPQDRIGWDDANVVYSVSTLDGLWELTKKGNGSDFTLVEIIDFYWV